MYRFTLPILILVTMILITACGVPEPPTAAECVTGDVVYRQKIALPQDAVVQIQIINASLMDAPAEVLGEQIITEPGQVPIPYEVCYDPSEINDNLMYSVSARITNGSGDLLFISDTVTPVITNGNPTEDVLINVIQVGA